MQRFSFLLIIFLMLGTQQALANPAQLQHNPARPEISIEWDNSRPEQRQALDNFYRSLEQHQLNHPQFNYNLDQRMLRQERIEQLRDMTPMQRQQQILDFTQQYQQHNPALISQP